MRLRKIDNPGTKAEGDIAFGNPRQAYAYDTDLVSINGVHILIWMGDLEPPRLTFEAARALNIARGERDIVSASYCTGNPEGYWAHNDIVGK